MYLYYLFIYEILHCDRRRRSSLSFRGGLRKPESHPYNPEGVGISVPAKTLGQMRLGQAEMQACSQLNFKAEIDPDF